MPGQISADTSINLLQQINNHGISVLHLQLGTFSSMLQL